MLAAVYMSLCTNNNGIKLLYMYLIRFHEFYCFIFIKKTLFILTLCIHVYFIGVDHVDIRLQNLIFLVLAFCNYSLQLKISSVLV